MKKTKFGFSKYIPLINALMDITLVNFAFYISHYFRFHSFVLTPEHNHIQFLFLVNILWIGVLYYQQSNEFSRMEPFESILKRFTGLFFIYVTTLYLFLFMLNFDKVSRLWIFYYLIAAFSFLMFARVLSLMFFKWYRKHGKNYRKIVIVGTDVVSMQLYDYLHHDLTLGFKILGIFDFGQNGENLKDKQTAPYLGDRSQLLSYLSENEVDEVYWKLTGDSDPYLKSIVEFCENNMIRLRLIPFFELSVLGRKPHIDMYNLIPVITLRKEPLQIAFNRTLKRCFDILFSFLVLLVIGPTVFLLVSILIKLNSSGPIFFKQLRSGENNREFWCFKFRTMKVNAQADQLQATKNDQRITSIGKFLRKTSLDELPQFWNVLKGEMSVVGPRPHMLKHTEEYSQTISKFLVRHYAKPGITGWAQINGFRGETKELEDMKNRVEADIWYVENWSLLLDIRIVLVTVWNMLRGEKNAY